MSFLRSSWHLMVFMLGALCPSASVAGLTSGSTFLQIDPTSRPAALAGAYTAGAEHVDAMHYNAGSLASVRQHELSFTHAEWLGDTNYQHAAYAYPTGYGTFGLSVLRLGYGDLERRDENRMHRGSFSADDSAYSLVYGRSLKNAGAGVAVKLLRRAIDRDTAVSYALDLGVVSLSKAPFQIGAAVLNIGPSMTFLDQSDPLPLTFALGTQYKSPRNFYISGDFKHEPHDQRTTAALGMDYEPISQIALRGGYLFPFKSTGDALWDLENMRGGIGLRLSRFRIDYALAPFGELGLTHRFTLAIIWGRTDGESDTKILNPAQGPSQSNFFAQLEKGPQP